MKNLAFILLIAAGLDALAVQANAQTYTYDAAGRLVRAAYANGTGVVYNYDPADNLTSAVNISLPAAPSRMSASRPTDGEVRLSWEAVPGATSGYVIMRRPRNGDTWTEIATVTSGLIYVDTVPDPSVEYVYRLAARGANGVSANSRDIYPSTRRAVEVVIEGGGARRVLTDGLNPTVRAGYALVPLDMGNAPYGIAVFRTTQNGVVASEAGVPATPPTTRARIFVDYRNAAGGTDIRTGVAMVNPGSKPATVTLRLRSTDGTQIALGTGTLLPGAHAARFVDEFSSIAPGFVLPPDFSSAVGFGTLDVESDQPVSTIALRLSINLRGELLFTSTPVADLTKTVTPGPIHFPHFADGGGFTTSMVLLNTSTAQQDGTINFSGTDGTPYVISADNGQTGSSFPYSIAPGGAFLLQSLGANPAVAVGSIRVSPAANSGSPFGSGLFRYVQGGIVVSESGIPSANTTTHARIYVDQTGGHDTGLALGNPSGSANSITIRAYLPDGSTLVGQAAVNVAPFGQRAAFVRELIPLPPGFTGVADITSSAPFSPLVVRLLTNSRNEVLLTTFPTADLTRPAPSPVIFPQIADGGGYDTELILISPHARLSGMVRYFDSNGVPMNAAQVPGP
jgi:YD repeat-containing protein